MKKRAERYSGVFRAFGPKLMDEVIELLIKVVGETIRDRIARAILVGIISSLGHYAVTNSNTDLPQGSASQPAVMNKAP